jgi:hypothetical protein
MLHGIENGAFFEVLIICTFLIRLNFKLSPLILDECYGDFYTRFSNTTRTRGYIGDHFTVLNVWYVFVNSFPFNNIDWKQFVKSIVSPRKRTYSTMKKKYMDNPSSVDTTTYQLFHEMEVAQELFDTKAIFNFYDGNITTQKNIFDTIICDNKFETWCCSDFINKNIMHGIVVNIIKNIITYNDVSSHLEFIKTPINATPPSLVPITPPSLASITSCFIRAYGNSNLIFHKTHRYNTMDVLHMDDRSNVSSIVVHADDAYTSVHSPTMWFLHLSPGNDINIELIVNVNLKEVLEMNPRVFLSLKKLRVEKANHVIQKSIH